MAAKRGLAPDTAAKKAPRIPSDAELRSQCVAFFIRTKDGKFAKSTNEEKEAAKEALDSYANYTKDEQLDFARTFRFRP